MLVGFFVLFDFVPFFCFIFSLRCVPRCDALRCVTFVALRCIALRCIVLRCRDAQIGRLYVGDRIVIMGNVSLLRGIISSIRTTILSLRGDRIVIMVNVSLLRGIISSIRTTILSLRGDRIIIMENVSLLRGIVSLFRIMGSLLRLPYRHYRYRIVMMGNDIIITEYHIIIDIY